MKQNGNLKNEFFIWGGGEGGRGEGGNQNDALGPRVQEHFEFLLYLIKICRKNEFCIGRGGRGEFVFSAYFIR